MPGRPQRRPMASATDFQVLLGPPLADSAADDEHREYERLSAKWEILKEEYSSILRENELLREELRQFSHRVGEQSRHLRQKSQSVKEHAKHACVTSAQLIAGAATLIEVYGVFWRVRPGQTADPTTYCPSCRRALTPFPPKSGKLLTCQTCGFVARGLNPREVPRIASQIRLSS